MATIKTWDMDGTFKLLIIHAIVASKLVPVVCCYGQKYRQIRVYFSSFNKQSACPKGQSLSTNNNL
ncbi:hypothetical protein T01_11894 [Trichinella spiralis]|uniref:Uncharacterized protein n=1 Tax=Trichinella spiralis TaxID=6334 RepID=A0A0V1BQ04_TRISP|nr:hypothetical protein T01_11894 [Trichinella spiralis]